MSFTGIFKAKNGIVAVVDSKASRVENGQSYEDVHRNPEKLFVFQNGIATTFGANQILVQNPFEFSSKVIAIEDLVYEYLHLKNILDASFFQSLLVKMTSNPANTEPVNFLVGRKIRQEEYILEHHQVRYCAYAQRLATPMEHFFTGGDEKYREHFDNLPYLSQITSVDVLQKTVCCFFKYRFTSFLLIPEPCFSFLCLNADSFSLYPQTHTNFCPSPSPTISIFL